MHKSDLPLFLTNHNKRHLIITGRKGAGKTTLFNQLCPEHCEGLRTTAQWDGGRTPACIVMEDLSTGQSDICALPGQDRMVALTSAFDQLGVPALTHALTSATPLFFMDEIGYMEWSQQDYCQALLALFDVKNVVAVLKKEDTPLATLILQRSDVYLLDLDET